MNTIQALLLFLLFGPSPHSLTIRFCNVVGSRPLRLDAETYSTRSGEPFRILQCKYYINDIRIGDGYKVERLLWQPHLLDQADSTSLELHFQTTIAGARHIRFTFGIDISYNTGGVQAGDLDPMLGMFWTWNTGYINARLEGASDSAHAPAHRFTWDIGGYRSGQNTLRTITLPLPITSAVIFIHTDLLNWFDGIHPIRLGIFPICHEPGPLAMQLADNITTSFSVNP